MINRDKIERWIAIGYPLQGIGKSCAVVVNRKRIQVARRIATNVADNRQATGAVQEFGGQKRCYRFRYEDAVNEHVMLQNLFEGTTRTSFLKIP